MNKEKLEPCPFCGKGPKLEYLQGFKEFAVLCGNLNCSTRSSDKSGDEARGSWNTRPKEQALQKEVDRLRKALEFYADNFKYPWSWPEDSTTEIIQDGGLVAKQALKGE